MASIHINNWTGSNLLDKELLKHKTTQPIEKLNEIVLEAVENDYYISITPSKGLSDEFKVKGDILVMFDNRRLVGR